MSEFRKCSIICEHYEKYYIIIDQKISCCTILLSAKYSIFLYILTIKYIYIPYYYTLLLQISIIINLDKSLNLRI